VLGDTANNGPLTLGGSLDFLNASRNLRFDSDVVVAGTMGNGIFNKDGLGTLTIKGAANFTKLDHNTFNGTVIFDGAIVTNNLFGWRVACSASASVSRLVITNNGLLDIDNSQKQSLNLRVGNTGGNATSTNIVDFWSGQIILQGGASGGSVFLGHTDSSRGIFNLNGGTLLCQRVTPGAVGAVSEFNFNGGVVRLSGANFLSTFMQDLTVVYIRSGGAFIDTAGYDVTLAQPLLDAGGGLTKSNAGALYLNGTNTYTGTTTVNGGALGGTGVISGPVVVTAAAALSFGPAISTLTVSNTLTLQGSALLKITKDSGLMSDRVTGLSAVTYGGALVVTNIGITALSGGDQFTLFSATAYNGTFASVSLPALPTGFSWDTSRLSVDGTIQVKAPLVFSAPTISGSNLILSGTGGASNGTYFVLVSTNIAVPRTNWTPIATDAFDGSGNFNFTNPISAGVPQQFYLLRVP
jgi:autotransporter-associated beta strand protein